MRKFGLETIAFGAAPAANPALNNLAPGQSVGARGPAGKGIVLSSGQEQTLTYNLNAQRTVNLSLEFQVTEDANTCAITVQWERNVIVRGYRPGNAMSVSWVVKSSQTLAGANTIRIKVDRGRGKILLKSVKVGNFEIRVQQRTNWCWVASALSVADYLDRSTDHGTQCAMYSKVKDLTKPEELANCCNLAREGFNNTGWPTGPLNAAKHLALPPVQPKANPQTEVKDANTMIGPADWNTVLKELGSHQPIICIITWKRGGSHAVVISSAYTSSSANMVVVDDPWSGARSVIAYEVLKTSYRQIGDKWTYTIFSK